MTKNQTWIVVGLLIILLCICATLSGVGLYYYRVQQVTPIPAQKPAPTATPVQKNTPGSSKVPSPAASKAQPHSIYEESSGIFEQLKLAFDSSGSLNLLFKQKVVENSSIKTDHLLYMQMTPTGQWSKPQRLSTAYPDNLDPTLTAFIPQPAGPDQVCAVVYGQIEAYGTYMRCFKAGQWSNYELVAEPDVSVVFAPDGSHHSVTGRGVSSVVFDKTPLTPANYDEIIDDLSVVIDPAGGYHVVWQEIGGGLVYRASTDKGQTWSPAETLTDEPTRPWVLPQLAAAPDGRLHLAWTGQQGVFYRQRPAGQSWQPVVQVSPVVHGEAILAVDGQGLAHIIWGQDNRLYYTRQSNNGWSQPQPIGDMAAEPGILERGQATLAVDTQGRPHLVWVGLDNKLYHAVLN